MEVLCENASRSQQCGEETAKGFVSLPGLSVRDTSPGAWEGWRQECGQGDWGQGGGGETARLPPHPTPQLPSFICNSTWDLKRETLKLKILCWLNEKSLRKPQIFLQEVIKSFLYKT